MKLIEHVEALVRRVLNAYNRRNENGDLSGSHEEATRALREVAQEIDKDWMAALVDHQVRTNGPVRCSCGDFFVVHQTSKDAAIRLWTAHVSQAVQKIAGRHT